MAPQLNKAQLKMLEDEYAALQRMEIAITGDDTATQKLIDKFASASALYANPKALQKMIDEIEKLIKSLALTAKERGKIMAEKAMTRFLEISKQRAYKITTLSAIRKANEKAFAQRFDLYLVELEKETGLLKADIDVFIKRALTAGVSKKEAVAQLVKAGTDRVGPVQGFAKRMKSLEVSILRREEARTEVDAYRAVAKPGEKWQWITISKTPCPDCQLRAGKILSLDAWQQLGMPGEGRTVCGAYCMCKLMPMTLAEEAFPEVKSFRWNPEKGVLTTASEARAIKKGG